MRSLSPIATIVALLLALAPAAHADEVYTFIVKKQEQKELKKWTLAEWLATKDRMRLMDMWLALHTPSPYEFFVSGDYQHPNQYGGAFAAYASLVGLEFQREWSEGGPANTGLFHLRIFGFADQSTHITLQAGVRDPSPGSVPHHALAGARLAVFLLRYFGIEGLFRQNFGPGTGQHYEGGAFIDFKFVRIFGKYFSEGDLPARKGSAFGARIYF
jgi:hypothetical protein